MRADAARVALIAVLAMVGGAGWVALPVAAADLVPDAWIAIAILALGTLVGAACAVAALPRVSRAAVVLAAPLAVAVVRAGVEVLDGRPLTVHPRDALLVGAALAAAGLGVGLARGVSARIGRVGAAAFVQLVIQLLTATAAVLLDSPTLSLVGFLVAAGLGGAVVVRLLPDVSGGEVAGAWGLFLVTAFATAALATSPARVLVTVILATVVVPVPAGLAALGAVMARRRPPTTALPDATVVR